MGIDIYAKWDGMTEAEEAAQITGFSIEHGHVGYLREAYHGELYATKVLVPEAFQELRVHIHAATLRDRLPATLIVAEARERDIYGATDRAEIEPSSRAIASSSNFARAKRRRRENPVSSSRATSPRLPAAHAAGKACFRRSAGAASFDFAARAGEVPRPRYMPLLARLIRLQRH